MPIYLSDNDFPKLILAEQGSPPATPEAGRVKLYVGTDGVLRRIMDDGDDAAVGASGLETGTSFPGSPATGDRYRRSDLGYLTFFYDGTYWLTEQVVSFAASIDTAAASPWVTGYSATVASLSRNALPGFGALDLDFYWTGFDAQFYVSVLNNGSNYWRLGDGTTDIDTSAESAGAWSRVRSTPNRLITQGDSVFINLTLTRVASGGTPVYLGVPIITGRGRAT